MVNVYTAGYQGVVTFWQKYGMTISSAVGTLVYAVIGYMSDGKVSGDEGVVFGVLLANTVLIYVVPVFPRYGWIKNAINGVLAVLALGFQALSGINTGQEVLLIAWTFATATGILASPAVSVKTGGVSSGVGGVLAP